MAQGKTGGASVTEQLNWGSNAYRIVESSLLSDESTSDDKTDHYGKDLFITTPGQLEWRIDDEDDAHKDMPTEQAEAGSWWSQGSSDGPFELVDNYGAGARWQSGLGEPPPAPLGTTCARRQGADSPPLSCTTTRASERDVESATLVCVQTRAPPGHPVAGSPADAEFIPGQERSAVWCSVNRGQGSNGDVLGSIVGSGGCCVARVCVMASSGETCDPG
ncbi:hypothetical protein PR048_027266 [Dryococelus australis]|uniref:Uncharacterized protein n=1 Tax=Dryococelus australis TaxID=614101 RepID=A0ABQ9GEZ4_9NEOP|nr:hypothetical protein PR048_027266 [Dryococelus australis]